MLSNENASSISPRESVEVPGVGEIRARPGTSTMALAGAAAYWHKKAQGAYADGVSSGRVDGALCATVLIAVLETAIYLSYHYLRSH